MLSYKNTIIDTKLKVIFECRTKDRKLINYYSVDY